MSNPQHSKNILITGGNAGIGLATAKALAGRGHSVIIACRNADKANKAIRLIQNAVPNAQVSFRRLDLASLDGTRRFAAAFLQDFPSLDVLINNAGISIRHDFLDITPEEWDAVLDVNLKGLFYVAQTAARHMVGKGSGVILNTASTAGNVGYPHYADYSASKGGVIGLTLAMALELAPTVRVNAISPGYVLTPMQRAEYSDEMLEAVNRKIPLERQAKPEEIASLYAYLASDDSAFATGPENVMDGAETTGGLCSQWSHE